MRLIPLALCLLAPTILAAQTPDSGALEIRQGGRVIGVEEFVVQAGRGRTPDGTTITGTVRYPPARPERQSNLLLELTANGSVSVFQLDRTGADGNRRIVGALAGDRLTVRTLASGSEAARQFPAGGRTIILDEEHLIPYLALARLATPGGTPVTAIFPGSGRRVALTATGGPDGSAATEVTVGGDLTATIRLDPQGRLLELDLPTAGLRASRLPR